MKNIEQLVRQNIIELQPYSSARSEYYGKDGVFLDANESPYGELNRYPDPYQIELKQKLASIKNFNAENIFIGNGSDEIIDLAIRIFCEPGTDKILTFFPSYSMYEVSAAINNVDVIQTHLDQNFDVDRQSLESYLNLSHLKIIFICSPNNPTGNLIKQHDLEFILKNFNGVVFLDEAYIDFASSKSLIDWTNKYENLIVCQTLSKSWGLASARIGVAFTNPTIITLFNKIKPPYSVSQLNQKAAINALNNIGKFKMNLDLIDREKKRLINALQKIDIIKKIYPSDANFLLLEVINADVIYRELVNEKIIVRNRNSYVPNCIRITVGTPEENTKLINALKQII